MENQFLRGFLNSKTSDTNDQDSERVYNFFEVRSRIIEIIGGYKKLSRMYKISGINAALRLARERGLRQAELDQLLQLVKKRSLQFEEFKKNGWQGKKLKLTLEGLDKFFQKKPRSTSPKRRPLKNDDKN